MVLNGEYFRSQKSNDRDAAYKLLHSTAMSRDELREFIGLVEENDNMDIDYNSYLVNIYVEEKNTESKRKHREKDEERSFSHEEENDREYELFLERLKKHENSFMLEYEENGVSVVIKYEGESSSDRECDLEPRRKLRSAMKQKDGPSDQMPRVENRGMLDSQSTPRTEIKKMLTWRQTRSKSKSEKEENAKLSTRKIVPHTTYPHSILALKGNSSSDKDCTLPKRMLKSATKPKTEHFNQMRDVCSDDSQSTSTEEMKKLTGKSLRYEFKREKEEDIMQLDPDYHAMLKNSKIINGHFVFTVGDHEVVYEERNGESILENKEHDKESYSDVEILDSAFYDVGESNISNHMDSSRQSEFRHKVITALRKPFDEVEYEKLWQDIELRKRVERHLDLRGGRDISYGKQKNGKSYLDYYPDLKRELLLVHHDKPKRLNLLRGFFLWLKQPESFSPWLDDECLAIFQESD